MHRSDLLKLDFMNDNETTNLTSTPASASSPAATPTEQYLAWALANLPAPECQIKDDQWFQPTETVRRRAELELVLAAAVAFTVKQDQDGSRLFALGLPSSVKLALIVEFGRKRARSGKAEGRLDQAAAVALSAIHYHDCILEKHLRRLDRSWFEDLYQAGLHLSAATQEMIAAVRVLGRGFAGFDDHIYPAMRRLSDRIHDNERKLGLTPMDEKTGPAGAPPPSPAAELSSIIAAMQDPEDTFVPVWDPHTGKDFVVNHLEERQLAAGGRRGPIAVGGTGHGPEEPHRQRGGPGGAAHRGLPAGGAQPDHHERPPHQ